MELNERQQAHLNRLTKKFMVDTSVKFKKGAQEHGGDLQDMAILDILDNALDEVIDQWVYLTTLKERLTSLADSQQLRPLLEQRQEPSAVPSEPEPSQRSLAEE